MNFPLQYTIFIILAPLAAIISMGLVIYILRYQPVPETSLLMWLLFSIAGWLIFNTLELVSAHQGPTVFWAKLSYAFITTTPVAWLAFALQYTAKPNWLKTQRFSWFFIIPLITTLLAISNQQHNLIWLSYDFLATNGLLAMHVVHGPWFWVHVTYTYGLVFGGAILIVWQYFLSFKLYRRQSVWILIGALTPVFVNIFYIFNVIPQLKKDYTPVSFAFAGLAFSVALLRYRLFDLKPVARNAVIEGMRDATITLDARDRIVDINPAAQALIAAGDDLIGQPLAQVFEPWRDWLADSGDLLDAHTDFTMPHGVGGAYYDLRVSPLYDHQGALLGRLVVVHDITRLKQIESALREHTLELEARNAELDAFAHTVAHDLKTPLTTIFGYSQLLQSQLMDHSLENTSYYLSLISDSSFKMTNIVDALLLLSSVRKLEAVSITPLDMSVIVRDVKLRLQRVIVESQVDLVVPASWPDALGYTPWVEEVWVNYLSNAIKYGGKPPYVELGSSLLPVVEGAPSMVRFWVRDNGAGIPLEKQAQLFVPFTRLEQTRVAGHGLGLSIARRIIERLDGQIGVDCQVGQGCIFWFTLPLLPHEADTGLVVAGGRDADT